MAKGRRIPDEVKKEAVRLANDGVSYQEISKRLGIGLSSICDAVRKSRIKDHEEREVMPEPINLPKLIPGKIYTIREIVGGYEQGRGVRVKTERMRYLETYPHVILFENQIGIKRSYQYIDLKHALEVS